MRDYELMYIVRPTVPEDQLDGVTDRVDAMIGNLGGEVREKQPWGKRRLAYPIEKHEDGYYFLERIGMIPGRTRELESQLRIADEVIRHLIVQRVEEAPPRKPRKPKPQQEEQPQPKQEQPE